MANYARLLGATMAFVSLTVSATQATTLPATFAAEGARIPNALLAAGIRQIGALDLAELVATMAKISVVSGSVQAIGTLNDDGRITAHWDAARLTLNVKAWNRWPEQRPVLALHEYLNFNRYHDEEYRLSMGLWTLSLPETQASLSASELSNLQESLARMTYSRVAGGVIGVGGGGESATLWARMRRVQDSYARMSAGGMSHEEAIQDLTLSLNANVTVSYPDAMSPATKRAIARKTKQMMAHPLCLVSEGTCEAPGRHASNECHCPGSSDLGVIIYPSN